MHFCYLFSHLSQHLSIHLLVLKSLLGSRANAFVFSKGWWSLPIPKGRSIMLVVGVFFSPEFAFGHFYLFANTVCVSAVLSCRFPIHSQLHLICTSVVGVSWILCSLLSLEQVLLCSQSSNLLVTLNWPSVSCDFCPDTSCAMLCLQPAVILW